MTRSTGNLAIAATFALLLAARGALAGGGPENVLVVVNANSAGSKAVANHYVRLRDVPASNVLALDYKGPLEAASGAVFRKQILQPIIDTINERGLALQIDMIAYSTDFPWRVTLKEEYPEDLKLPAVMSKVASLNGATFLYGFALAKSPGITSFDSNWYYATAPGQSRATNQQKCRLLGAAPSRGFRSRYLWNPAGGKEASVKRPDGDDEDAEDQPVRRYLLSTMLGVTTGRGNTVDEVIASLERAVEAEASPPTGTFYFMRNNDIRSQVRHGCYDVAAEQLRRLGAKAVVKVGVRPAGADDVAGLMMGSPHLALDTAAMTIQPGAICEHLTSTGGMLFKQSEQTSIAELIRAGATGTSGTVNEPYGIQVKFPSPMLPIHYRRGCSLAEAFYQSVAAPYQLLILGDPLCQPWAKRPTLEVEGWPEEADEDLLKPGATSTIGFEQLGLTKPAKRAGPAPSAPTAEVPPADTPPAALRIKPRVTPNGAKGTAFWELFVDGRLRMRLPSDTEAAFTTDQLGPGWHDLRCVGINPDAIEAQRRRLGGLEVGSGDGPGGAKTPRVTLKLDAKSSTPLDGEVALAAQAEGAERIVIRHNFREVATIDGDGGDALVPADLLGQGPVRLQAVAEPGGALSEPVWLRVE
ncbi:hypothetical protein [Botrimarina mediterranea]|uniref:Uncharacterized protein n=1 Tax=Botrimarina mediterranea TaxID=2528022 RepID=A0A518KEX9_9BACT|nr:hypothetical protein [Botrimarina mediterranea]QDV76354.1 hypothetical protein Spa11_45840 [Botrimarina mediterranea]QDV80952.1 hypothetical protein K2D_45870 [Planctomycetes bacterium K2D]